MNLQIRNVYDQYNWNLNYSIFPPYGFRPTSLRDFIMIRLRISIKQTRLFSQHLNYKNCIFNVFIPLSF